MSPEQKALIERNLEHHKREVDKVEADLADLTRDGGSSVDGIPPAKAKTLAWTDLVARLKGVVSAYERLLMKD